MNQTRRDFLKGCSCAAATGLTFGSTGFGAEQKGFRISLNQWSLHNALFGRNSPKMDPLDYAKVAKETCGINAIEYHVRFIEKPANPRYLRELNKCAADHGVKPLLILLDSQGYLGDPDAKLRDTAIENHKKWLEVARTLGCQSIRTSGHRQPDFIKRVEGLSGRYTT